MALDTITALQRLGFTEYEARAYVALLEGGELTGYELAKRSGIPRPNVYPVLEKLIDRGAACRRLDESGQRYAPVPPKQLLAGVEAGQRRVLADAGDVLARHPQAQPSSGVYSLSGPQLLIKARQLIESCERSLLIAIQPAEAAQLADSLRGASARGVTVTTLCLTGCERECGGCTGSVHRHPVVPSGGPRWLIVVADGGTSLVGELDAAAADGALTQHRPAVALAAAYVRQTIALAMLGYELAADSLQDLLARNTP
ncbi:MAG: TrmB family transcriptional regulator [Steroidobacteraceae bacterium]